ncbi:tumor necrosis factor receptor superfamily member 5-like isoform X2 [Tachysurus fulvidraco]|nr:tumor necrosis factor receptor superfamily member 5-like isoform X2 [Tachysurus fulvidraco]
MCNTVNGLRVKANCTQTSDTVCEPLEGFYCTEEYSVGCSYAVEHTKCSSGQYIKQKGTKASDTVCEPCSPGFYSPKVVNCSKWTDCSVRNEIEDKEGTSIKDIQCKPQRKRYGLIAALLTTAVVLLFLLLLLYLKHRSRRTLKTVFTVL